MLLSGTMLTPWPSCTSCKRRWQEIVDRTGQGVGSYYLESQYPPFCLFPSVTAPSPLEVAHMGTWRAFCNRLRLRWLQWMGVPGTPKPGSEVWGKKR